ncbi:unnamed protein product [Protopolystoma xenopodis]|uniref:PDE1 N-terminal domain-containing protein n=1 Tax=Protopolystoma xenopodis TaxID=117903 RepID=A0A3S5CC95_9PLAT|nr:unnamed protein product [Protopolystoma xenopodis]
MGAYSQHLKKGHLRAIYSFSALYQSFLSFYTRRRLRDEEDDLSEVTADVVPNEVRDWLASTFTRTMATAQHEEAKTRFRSVANAIRAGIMVERQVKCEK